MNITHSDNSINFQDEKMEPLGYTDYDEELLAKIMAVKWTVSKGRYLYSSSLKKTLHQLVMIHWYGEEAFAQAKKNGFIVEHHNNEGFDCRISNLSFALARHNKAKAFTYDQDRLEVMSKMAVNFYKDYKSGRYQITVAFNKSHYLVINNKIVNVTAIYLLYINDFFRTMTDATILINEMQKNGRFKLSGLRYEKLQYEEAKLLDLEPGQEEAIFFELEGKSAIRLGTDHAIMNQISPDQSLYINNDGEES